ncbi:hypothetical protein [Janibacter cremeus]|uniref:Uridine kinase n=1 Tax=Janibacter cremeus TaxID=1285192 RepID=A0A852W0R8_9MICO|nr:hypothetical protein [Janibacter cremeus]NYF99575.1 hypothetical protein [Janibacter cremeus]
MPPLTQILAHARDAPPSCGRVHVIGVDGRSGAGKTSLAHQVATAWSAPVVSMDEIYPGWDGLAEGAAILLSHVLIPLSRGRNVAVPTWDWVRDAPGAPRRLEVGDRLVVEGCGSTVGPAADLIGTLVWLDGHESVRRERAIVRDGEVFAAHWDMWAQQEARLFGADRTRERADLVLRV